MNTGMGQGTVRGQDGYRGNSEGGDRPGGTQIKFAYNGVAQSTRSASNRLTA